MAKRGSVLVGREAETEALARTVDCTSCGTKAGRACREWSNARGVTVGVRVSHQARLNTARETS